MTDVANVFDQVSVGNLHTPALYSCFLRALVTSRTEGAEQQQADGEATGVQDAHAATSNSHMPPPQQVNGHGHVNGHSVHAHAQGLSLPPEALAMDSFGYSGEMGPVADISTFPPTMAPHPSGMDMNVLSMDSILSSEFWDSVLVPGACDFVGMLSRVGKVLMCVCGAF